MFPSNGPRKWYSPLAIDKNLGLPPNFGTEWVPLLVLLLSSMHSDCSWQLGRALVLWVTQQPPGPYSNLPPNETLRHIELHLFDRSKLV